MKSRFSKPSADVAPESLKQFEENLRLVELQQRISATLKAQPNRTDCLMCGKSLAEAEQFIHRTVEYRRCTNCGHIQTTVQPPPGYPPQEERSFSHIYPQVSPSEYESRKNRIYRPKLEWILDCHDELKHSRDSLINARWLDLGCGGGYFLKALADVGAKRILGLEQDSRLVQMANEALGQKQVECYAGSLAQAVEDYEADIYTAFFVIEHVEKIHTFFSALGRCPSGTIFAFSVPTFGFTTLLESAFSDHFARQLDNVLHTQLYTDSSIRYGLQLAGYVPVAEWVFGQDALDFSRLLLLNLQHHYSTTMLQAASEDLARICDQLQAVLDQNHMADSRHVLAVKV